MQLMLPQAYGRAGKPEQQQSQRLTDALFSEKNKTEAEQEKLELEARLTFSSREVLARMDFDTMSAAELVEAKKMLSRLRLPLPLIRTRRKKVSKNGKTVDLRATLRESMREGGGIIPLVRAAPGRAAPAAGRAVRHLGLDEPVLAHVPALPACHHQRPRPRHRVRVRHAADQHHAPAAPPRRRRRHGAGSPTRSRTGRAARASATACASSTSSGAGACWRRTPACCSSPTASTARPAKAWARKWSASPSRATAWCGSTRCCATRSSRRGRPACARCCRTSISSCRCIISRAWSTWRKTLSRPLNKEIPQWK